MIEFYLNDCLPSQPKKDVDVYCLFHDMVVGFKDIHQRMPLDVSQSLVMSEYVDNTKLCGVSLRDLLNRYKSEKEFYSYASRLFTNGMSIKMREMEFGGDPELDRPYLCNNRDAHNLLVAQKTNMIAATIPVEDELCKDELSLIYTNEKLPENDVKTILNWYILNSSFIITAYKLPLPSIDKPWERMMAMLSQHGNVVCGDFFINEWKKLGFNIRQSIVNRFEDALNGGLLFPANNNNPHIVKRDQKDRDSKVHELRQKGTGFRVYFECDEDAIYIALYGSKTVHYGKDQESDFIFAKEEVQRLRAKYKS